MYHFPFNLSLQTLFMDEAKLIVAQKDHQFQISGIRIRDLYSLGVMPVINHLEKDAWTIHTGLHQHCMGW